MDNEYIYPYWENAFPKQSSGRSYSWDDPQWEPMDPIPITEDQWMNLVLLELSGKPENAAVCGRFYEHLLSNTPNYTGMIEGAPWDGFTPATSVRRHLNFYAQSYWMTSHLTGIPWEMKKLIWSTERVFFNPQNISALEQLGGGWLIGASVHPTQHYVFYKRIWLPGREIPEHNYNLRIKRKRG